MLSIDLSKRFSDMAYGQATAKLMAIEALKPDEIDAELARVSCLVDGPHIIPQLHYIQLVFIGNKKIPFSVLVKYGSELFAYYSKFLGRLVEIEYV